MTPTHTYGCHSRSYACLIMHVENCSHYLTASYVHTVKLCYAAIDVALISTWPLDAVNALSDMYDAALHLHRRHENAIHPSQLLLLLLVLHCYSSSLVLLAASAPPERISKLCLAALVGSVLYLDVIACEDV